MTDPMEEGLRRALQSGGAGFEPDQPLGTTRAAISGRIIRRRRCQAMASGGAAVLVVALVAVTLSLGRSGTSSSRQVAAQGGDHSTQTSILADGAGVAFTPGPGSATPPRSSDNTIPPSSSPGAGGPATTVGSPSRATIKPPPTGTTPTTFPTFTTPLTTVFPAASAVRGTVLFGPVCPVERVPPDPACAPRPGPAHIALVRADGTVAGAGDAGANGQFVIGVPAGTYTVRATTTTAASIGRGCSANPAQVTVTGGAPAGVAVACDTGIR